MQPGSPPIQGNVDPRKIYVRTQTEILTDGTPSGHLRHEIIDISISTGKIVFTMNTENGPLRLRLLEHDAGMAPNAVELWDLDHPKLYHLRSTWVGEDGNTDSRTIAFGFRSLAPSGLGTNAISWGYWGLSNVEVIAAYSRDHDRNIGAGTFTTKLGAVKMLYQRVPRLHPVLRQRFLANVPRWLTS
jgi:Glycosyl hydrolases family 2